MSKYVRHYTIDRPFLVLRLDPLRLEVRQATEQGFAICPPNGVFDASYINSTLRRGRVQRGGRVCGAITSASAESLLIFVGICRTDASR